MSIIGGLASSRLDNTLVRTEKLAVSVSADIQSFEKLGMAEVTVDVAPGADPVAVGKRLDEILADFTKNGQPPMRCCAPPPARPPAPSPGSSRLVACRAKRRRWPRASSIRTIPKIPTRSRRLCRSDTRNHSGGGDEMVLPSGLPPDGQPRTAHRKRRQSRRRHRRRHHRHASSLLPPAQPAAAGNRRRRRGSAKIKAPDVAAIADVTFPKIERAKLSNGIPVLFARRDTVPTVRIALTFDGGASADPKDRQGTNALMMALLDEGTATRDSAQIAADEERLGASISLPRRSTAPRSACSR